MATKEKHLEKYYHNKNFSHKGITNTDVFLDWYIVAMFYCGVHLMEAYLADKQMHSDSHADRENLLRGNIGDDEMIAYRALYSMSLKSRYECIKIINHDAILSQEYLDALEKFCGVK